MSFEPDARIQQNTFLYRVLRLLAALGMVCGLLALVNMFAFYFTYGWNRAWPNWLWWRGRLPNSLYLLALASISILQMIGSWGLWRWRAWSRRLLIAWAAIAVLFGIINTLGYLVSYSRAISTTTQPAAVSLPYMILMMSFSFLNNATLALVTLFVMTERTLAELWAPLGTGGFQVVPLAHVARGSDQDAAEFLAGP
jgi:hypothetical protein